jgi:hypothetical protein
MTQVHNAEPVRPGMSIHGSEEFRDGNTLMRSKTMTSGFAKGIFIGGFLGTVAAMLFALRNRIDLSSDIPESEGGTRQLPVSSPEAREESNRTKLRVKRGRAWRVMFYVAFGIAMFADSRIKKA